MDQTPAPLLISLRDVTLRVQGRPAFANTDWDIRQGEHWAILGQTGAGKSLLAAALTRRLSLHRGEIRYFFQEADGPGGRPWVYPREILTLSAESHRSFLARFAGYHQARWHGMEGEDVPSVRQLFRSVPEADERRQAEIASLLRLEPLWDRKLLHLSHGESRKAHLAFLLLQNPRLLILDDPYVGLDAAARERLAAALEDLLQQTTPQLLLISSRAEEIPTGIHRLLLVRDLQVQSMGARETTAARLTAPQAVPSGPAKAANPLLARVAVDFAAALNREELHFPEVVRMDEVSVQYGAVPVLLGINWQVRRGERWALSGPNGAGKTTLLSLILADNPKGYANDIHLFGRKRGSGESIWEIKRHIGWVSPELQAHYPLGTACMEVVRSGLFDSVGLYRHCSPEQDQAAQTWLAALGLEDLAGTAFDALSSGQQRLVLLARALVKDPPLLVLDEPCQGLDAPHRICFVELLDHICRHAPLTLIYVTHHPDELPASITHSLRLEQGRVAAFGPRAGA